MSCQAIQIVSSLKLALLYRLYLARPFSTWGFSTICPIYLEPCLIVNYSFPNWESTTTLTIELEFWDLQPSRVFQSLLDKCLWSCYGYVVEVSGEDSINHTIRLCHSGGGRAATSASLLYSSAPLQNASLVREIPFPTFLTLPLALIEQIILTWYYFAAPTVFLYQLCTSQAYSLMNSLRLFYNHLKKNRNRTVSENSHRHRHRQR